MSIIIDIIFLFALVEILGIWAFMAYAVLQSYK